MFKYITERGVMKVSANSDIRVVELFAGVGGFRVPTLFSAKLIASQNFASRPIFDFPDEKSSFSFHSKSIFHGILAANPVMQRRGRKKNRTFR